MTALTIDTGHPLPLGPTISPKGVNFSLFSRHATSVTLVVFNAAQPDLMEEVVLDPVQNRTGDIWHVLIAPAGPGLRYAYRVDGPDNEENPVHRFDKQQLLLDPYARALVGAEVWGTVPNGLSSGEETVSSFQRHCLITEDDFDWEGDRPLNIPLRESIIYELHTRGYTIHPSAGVEHPGTFRGLTEKIPYLKALGITAVELLPVFEFNELENRRRNPTDGTPLKNFWGYSTLGFFAPKASYADEPRGGGQVRAFKEMVKTFHREGLEIILDVVFNHTAEGDEAGPTVSFRGLDNAVYYLMDPETRHYLNLSGCGNTVNCNHWVVRGFILDCLRYWVLEMHVDGFRFDLATILNRDGQGRLMTEGSLIDMIEQDPVLADTKIIAEAWDTGASQVGAFPGRWAEWNAFYRDDVKRFIRGDRDTIPALATRIAGSSDLFQTEGRCPYNSINYLTCHDGFTLYDLMSYNEKHNLENGEENRDGTNDNISRNNGVEGPTEDPAIQAFRFRKMRTAFTLLMVSQGVPMILAGDEFARTQEGNNNAYCQDNETSWVDWGLEKRHHDLVRFCRKMIALRKRHPVFQRMHFLSGVDTNGDDHPDLGWHGLEPNRPDWSSGSPVLAFTLDGAELDEDRPDDDFLILLNSEDTDRTFSLASLPEGRSWIRLVDTGKPSPEDIRDEDEPDLEQAVAEYTLLPGAAAVLISKRP